MIYFRRPTLWILASSALLGGTLGGLKAATSGLTGPVVVLATVGAAIALAGAVALLLDRLCPRD